MADEPDNLVLEYMRRFDAQLKGLDAKVDRLSEDVRDLSVRMTHVEDGVRE